ncbi:MAG: enoyl-CoA hydratase/isomerase family protein [Pseudomonadota bacterium]
MDYSTLTFNKENGIGTITLNRPKQKNAINGQMIEELSDLVKAISTDDEVKVVVLTGGNEYFAAGADINLVQSVNSPMQAYDFSRTSPISDLDKLEKPSIAAISGFCLGGGLELALACDLRIASDTSVLGQPEINLGIIPGSGGTQRLTRIVGIAKAKELLYTGDIINAAEALRINLVNKVVPVDSLSDEVNKMAKKMASKPAMALKITKAVVNAGINMDLESALKMESQSFALLFSTEDKTEGVAAFLEKRKPNFKGK